MTMSSEALYAEWAREDLRANLPREVLIDLERLLTEGEPLPLATRCLLINAVSDCLQSADGSLDRAIGLRRHGGVSVARQEKLSSRNEIICHAWHTVPDWKDLPPASAARAMSLSAERYERDRWQRDRDTVSAPSSEPAATWWRVLKICEGIPGAAQITNILKEKIQVGV